MFKDFRVKLLLSILLLAVILLIPHIVKSTSWNDNFGYRKEFTVNNPNSSVLTNYPIQVTLYQGAGTDTNSAIHLDGNVQSDFRDIRFTASDGVTNLPYWIESTSSGVTVVWVNLDSLSASSSTNFYIYYGNPDASSASSAQNTFSFYDNFDTNGIAGWTGSDELNDHGQETGQQSQSVATDTYVSSPNSSKLHTYASCFSGPFDGVRTLLTASPGLAQGNYKVEFSVKLQITDFRFNTGGVQRSRVRINGTEQYYDELGCSGSHCTANGDWSNESFTLTDSTVSTIQLVADAYDCIEGNTYYDNVRIRHYVSNEPTITAVANSQVTTGSTFASDNPAPAPSSCEYSTPEGAPDLFQIDTTSTTATLYFTPLMDTAQYFISYSTNANAEDYSALVDLGREGVQHYTIESLSPGKKYYYKVRGQNGCQPGAWSNTRSAGGGAEKVTNRAGSALGTSSKKLVPTVKKASPTVMEPTNAPAKKTVVTKKEETPSLIEKVQSFFKNLF